MASHRFFPAPTTIILLGAGNGDLLGGLSEPLILINSLFVIVGGGVMVGAAKQTRISSARAKHY